MSLPRLLHLYLSSGLGSLIHPPFSGTENTQLSDTANAVLYALFAVTGFFAGSINVRPSIRLNLA